MPRPTPEQLVLASRGLKKCSKCHTVGPLSDFVHSKTTRKINSWCLACRRVYARAYIGRNRDRVRQGVIEWKKQNPGRVKELDKKSRERIRSRVLEMFGGKCCRCGFSDHRALQLDHIHQAREARCSYQRAGNTLYSAILRGERDVREFQLLCANCNWIKRYENNEHNRKNHPVAMHEVSDGE